MTNGTILAVTDTVNQIETRIAGLVNWVKTDGAYCCTLESVADQPETPKTVRVTMSCRYHKTYSFEIPYTDPVRDPQEPGDSVLMRLIAFEIVKKITSDESVKRN